MKVSIVVVESPLRYRLERLVFYKALQVAGRDAVEIEVGRKTT
jgi:hypothetical protein